MTSLNWSDYRAVLFDLDGVVTPTAIVHMRAWSEMFNAYLESYDGEGDASPYTDADYLRCAIQNSVNMAVWLSEPAVVKWINASRIDLFSPLLDFDSDEGRANLQAMGELIQKAVPRLQALLDTRSGGA